MSKMDHYFLENIQNSKLKSIDISTAIGIGEKTSRNKVKEITGHTVKAYLKLYRIAKAKELLASGYGTKSEIARAVGFSSLSCFTKTMKGNSKNKLSKPN